MKGTIKGTPNDTITSFVNNTYEYETAGATITTRKYYYAGGARIAERVNSTLSWLFGNHPSLPLGTRLGSRAITKKVNGTNTGELRYYACVNKG